MSVGEPLIRVDGVLKVTGQARYAVDVSLDHLAHAVLVRGTATRGRIEEIDTAGAQAAPGVIAVMTHRNAPRLPYGEPPPGQRPGPEPQAGHCLRMLQDDRVLFNGQPVAIVVAEGWEQARYAGSMVKVSYAPESHTTLMEAGMGEAHEPTAPRWQAPGPRGVPEAAFEDAEVRLDERYSTPMEHHNPMGLITTVASWEGAQLTIHDTTQWVDGVRDHLARVFGMDPGDVRVLCPFTGGGFGAALRAWPHVVAAAMAAQIAGRPVKLVLSRSDMYTSNGHRPETRHRVRLGATPAGGLVALLHDAFSSTSRYEDYAEGDCRLTRILYACPSVSTTYRLVPLDVGTSTPMRGPGESTGGFALESAVDELASALGADPLELRLRNYADADPERGLPWSSNALRECYRGGAERFGWSRRNSTPGSMREGRFLAGLGMAAG